MGVSRAVLLVLAACSSNKPRAADDAPVPPRTEAAVVIDAAPPPTDAPPSATGDLQVRVEWKDVPIAMRASPGRTACNTPRAPVVAPTTTWGIPDVIVVIEGVRIPPRDPRVVLAECALEPRALAGGDVVVASATDRPARVTLAKRGTLADLAKLAAPAPRTILLPIAGHAVKLPLETDAIYELAADGETAWIVTAANAGVTDAHGQLVLRDIAVGKYAITAWLPPRAGGPAKRATGTATVTADDLAELVLELK